MERLFFIHSFTPFLIFLIKLLPGPNKQFLPTPFKAQLSVMKNLDDKNLMQIA